MFRIGHGFDVHKFGGVGPCTLGGVKVPYEQGLIAHSDGDVVLHAISDALLGALALGDIGHFYPDNDDRFLNIDSRILIMAQAPRMAAYESEMIKNVASDLKVDVSCVSIKATTTEKLGFTGRKEGIAVESVALLQKTE